MTNTQTLSKRKSTLTDELITEAYQERFQKELKQLGAANLKIDIVKTRAEVGRVYHSPSLRDTHKDVKPSDILSEGEFRIVSLAVFLADTEGRGAMTPFIFDDPISSLDHVYEDAVAKRLVELSKSRQVIVFSHRLSLVYSLDKYSKKNGIETNTIRLSSYTPGAITYLPLEIKNTEKAVKTLKNEHLAQLRKAFGGVDPAYEKEAKSICYSIYELLERIVEKDLLNEVIHRFSPEVNTKGKIHALAKITEDDCTFVDTYMTKYARYRHSQPDDAPINLPNPDEIESDLNDISKFIEGIKARAKT